LPARKFRRAASHVELFRSRCHPAFRVAELFRLAVVRQRLFELSRNVSWAKCESQISRRMCAVRSADEYVRLGGFVHVNSAENYFSIFKRGVIGTFHHISEQHLDRYLAEFDFRYNNRSGLGVEDAERVTKIAAGITGKRLTYRRSNEAAHA
jgi:ISXO2-like transposase domain